MNLFYIWLKLDNSDVLYAYTSRYIFRYAFEIYLDTYLDMPLKYI